ncbi:MAG: hypothetical protein Q8N18_11725 [Opitutaceae bacterium]|nr:hypothetical protein [Opitutaceae bacterium]
MHQPARKRNIAATVLLVLLVTLALAYAFSVPRQTLIFVNTVIATAAFIAAIFTVMLQIDVRRFDRLKRGEGVLATWTVAPEQWARFGASSREWDTRPGIGSNTVDLAQAAEAGGILITVSDNALLVGRDFYSLEKSTKVRVYDTWMEFNTYNPGSAKTSGRHLIQRVPVAPGAEASARRIAQHYTQVYAAAVAAPFSRLKALLVVGGITLLPALAALVAWWLD